MNPDTGQLEVLQKRHDEQMEEVARRLKGKLCAPDRSQLVRPDGSEVPAHWVIFTAGELVTVKDQTFRVAYINECTLILEPVKAEDALKASGT